MPGDLHIWPHSVLVKLLGAGCTISLQVEYPLSKMFGTRNVRFQWFCFCFSFSFWNSCVYTVKYVGMQIQVQTQNLFVLFISYTYSMKVILYIFSAGLYFVICCVRAGEKFFICGMLELKKFQILEHFGFHIFRQGLLNSHFSLQRRKWSSKKLANMLKAPQWGEEGWDWASPWSHFSDSKVSAFSYSYNTAEAETQSTAVKMWALAWHVDTQLSSQLLRQLRWEDPRSEANLGNLSKPLSFGKEKTKQTPCTTPPPPNT